MIKAGAIALAQYDDDYETPRDGAIEVHLAMERARRGLVSEDDPDETAARTSSAD